MLWRVRTTLPDRPGTLAALAQRCGDAGVNILGLQVFPGIGEVTDELIVRTPYGWEAPRLIDLVDGSGGSSTVVLPSREAALMDQPTRYIRAAQMIIERPMSFPEIVSRLFDTAADPRGDDDDALDVMEMTVGEMVVHVRRRTPFTATEHARGAALADLVSDSLRRTAGPAADLSRAAATTTLEYVVDGNAVTAYAGHDAVGRVTLIAGTEDGDGITYGISLTVEPSWRRRGIGTQLLVDAARLARGRGAEALVITTAAEDPAVLPLVLAAGLRGLIRLSSDELTVRVPVARLRPLVR